MMARKTHTNELMCYSMVMELVGLNNDTKVFYFIIYLETMTLT
jgi:hypothetical protein